MSLTYTDDTARTYTETPARSEEAYVPVYARSRSRKARRSGVRSWMILAPIGVLVLGGAAAMMLMDSGREAPALAEPAATAPVMPAAAPAALNAGAAPAPAPVEAAPLPREAAPAPAPVRRAAPARRTAPTPARREAAPAAAAPEAAAAVETSETTVTLNTAPAASEAPPPRIVVAPLE